MSLQEIEVESNKNNSYSIILENVRNSTLMIQAIQKNNLFHKSFSNKFTIEKIKENKYFSLFDDLKEICNEISERIKKKEMKLIENKNILILSISLPITKIKEITFELNEDQKDEKEKMNDLTKLIFKLENKINVIKSEHKKEMDEIKNEHKKEMEELKDIVKSQKKEINLLKEQIKTWLDYKNNKTQKISGLKDSMIIDNNIDYNKSLKLWISPNKKIKANLLYKLSRDGEEFSKFHQLCDNKGPTLTLFDIEDGIKGGIYTPLSWNSNSEWKTDMDTFIFNLSKNQKYKKIQNYNSIFCESDYGPWVNGFGFLGDNQMKEIQLYGPSINYCYEKGSEILPNNGSTKKYFKVTEVEIYKITIN